jgi:hypothetical protein
VVILALNAAQSALDRYPDCEAVEVGKERVVPTRESGATMVNAACLAFQKEVEAVVGIS